MNFDFWVVMGSDLRDFSVLFFVPLRLSEAKDVRFAVLILCCFNVMVILWFILLVLAIDTFSVSH